MKDGCKYTPLGELCSTINGLWKGKKAPFVHVGVIRNANFTKEFTLDFSKIEYLDVEERQYKTRKLQKGDLIVEKSGGSEKQPVGRAILFNKEEGEFSFSNFTSVLRIKDSTTVTSEFLYKYILYVYQRGDTRSMQKATTGIHNIEFDKYLAIEIPVPPLSEQQRIVTYLDDAFAKIDLIKQKAEKSLSEAKALFQSALKEMMEPKEGWEEKTLKDVVDVNTAISYGIVQPGDDIEGGIPVVRPVDLIQKRITLTDKIKRTSKANSDSYKRTLLNGREILMCVRGTTGVVSLTDSTFDGCNVTRGIVPLKIEDNILRLFVYYSIISPIASNFIQHNTKGAALKQINIADVKLIPIYLPDKETQQQIVSRLDTLSETLHQLESNYTKTVAECGALKQALLRQVFE